MSEPTTSERYNPRQDGKGVDMNYMTCAVNNCQQALLQVEIDRLRAENERLKICIAARDELLDVKNGQSPEGLSVEEKLIWQLGNMMDNVENHYGVPNSKREGHIYSTAVRILDDAILAKTAKEAKASPEPDRGSETPG